MKRKRSYKTLLTIPDAIDHVKKFFVRQLDKYYAIVEHWSSKLNVWAWQKRWKNREEGTGYR